MNYLRYSIAALLLVSCFVNAADNNKTQASKGVQELGGGDAPSLNPIKGATPAQQRVLIKNDQDIRRDFQELRGQLERIDKLLTEWSAGIKNFDTTALCGAVENIRANIKKLSQKTTKDSREVLEAYVLQEQQFKKDMESKNITCER